MVSTTHKSILLLFICLSLLISVSYAAETSGDIYSKAKLLLNQGRQKEALKYADKYIKIKPRNHEGYQLKGLIFYSMGKNDEALKNFTTSKKLFSGDYVSETYIGFTLIRKNKFNDAAKRFQEAIKLNEDYPDAKIGMGYVLLKEKKYKPAVMYMKQAIKVCHDHNPEVYKRIADIYIKENKINDAIYVYNQYIKLEDANADIYFRLGKAYAAKDNKRAEKAYLKAIELDGKNPRYKEELADYLSKRKRADEAAKYYEQAAEQGSKNWRAYYQAGLTAFSKEDYLAVVKHMKKALSLNKNIPNAQMALSASYLRLKKYEESIKVNNDIIKRNNKSEGAWFNNACAYAMLGKTEQALTALAKSIELENGNKEIAKQSKMFDKIKNHPDFIKLTK